MFAHESNLDASQQPSTNITVMKAAVKAWTVRDIQLWAQSCGLDDVTSAMFSGMCPTGMNLVFLAQTVLGAYKAGKFGVSALPARYADMAECSQEVLLIGLCHFEAP